MRWFGRLRRSGEIAFVRRRGRVMVLPTMAVYASDATRGPIRVCVTASKAVGGAVVRNNVRRRIHGALDALAPRTGCHRLLFLAKPAAAEVPFAVLARDVALALDRFAPESGARPQAASSIS